MFWGGLIRAGEGEATSNPEAKKNHKKVANPCQRGWRRKPRRRTLDRRRGIPAPRQVLFRGRKGSWPSSARKGRCGRRRNGGWAGRRRDANMSGPPVSSHRVGLAIAMCLCEKLAPRGTSPTKEPPNRGGLMTMGEDTHCPRRLGRGAPSCASPASRQRTGTAHRRPPTGGSQPSPPRSLEPRRGRGHEGPNQRSGADVTDRECQQGGAGDWGPRREGLCREWHNRLH